MYGGGGGNNQQQGQGGYGQGQQSGPGPNNQQYPQQQPYQQNGQNPYHNNQQQQPNQWGGGGAAQQQPNQQQRGSQNNYNQQQQNNNPYPQAQQQQQQQPNLMDIFSKVDKNNSRQIDATELQQALSNGTWRPFNPETCRLLVALHDQDSDAHITFNEFQQLWKYVTDWTTCFKGLDRDSSGNVDMNELKQALTQFGYRLSEPFYGTLMRKYDRSKSGQLAFDDFMQLSVALQMLTTAFRDKDSDRDGVITVQFEEFLQMVMSTKL
jgi:Ca2+-binding EF-hand superfamily protein